MDYLVTVGLGVNMLQRYHCLVAGSEYGMADLHGYPMFERFPALCKLGADVMPAGKFPRLTAWTSAMQRLACVRKCWISPQLHKHFFVGYKSGSVDYDVEMDAETLAVQNSVR